MHEGVKAIVTDGHYPSRRQRFTHVTRVLLAELVHDPRGSCYALRAENRSSIFNAATLFEVHSTLIVPTRTGATNEHVRISRVSDPLGQIESNHNEGAARAAAEVGVLISEVEGNFILAGDQLHRDIGEPSPGHVGDANFALDGQLTALRAYDRDVRLFKDQPSGGR